MHSLDYSLQLQLGLALGVGDDNPNPCIGSIPDEQLPAALDAKWRALFSGSGARDERSFARPAFEGAKTLSKKDHAELPPFHVFRKQKDTKAPGKAGEVPENWALPPQSK